jgi:hypothetical protein
VVTPAGRSPDPAAPAEGPRSPASDVLAILPIEIEGTLPEHVVRSLEERLATGLLHSDLAVIRADAVRARQPTADCGSDCLRSAALAAGATHLVHAKIAVAGRDYTIEVALVRVDSGEQVAISSGLCEICGHEELGDRLDDLAGAIRRKASAAVMPPPRLRVRARPEGSIVSVDGEAVGVAPLEITVAAGEHDVVVHKRGFIAERHRLAFVDGVVETIDAELGPVPVEPPALRPGRIALGWTSLALGVGAGAAGAALLALDERPIRSDCAGANVDADGDCKWRYNTLSGGVVLAIAGLAAITVGAIVIARERLRGKRSRTRPTASVQGFGLGLRF